MDKKPQLKTNRSQVITASEISQYTYCPMSWYLKRCGYEPISPFLESGKNSHIHLGETLDFVQHVTKKQYRYIIIGVFLLLVCFFIFLFGVIL